MNDDTPPQDRCPKCGRALIQDASKCQCEYTPAELEMQAAIGRMLAGKRFITESGKPGGYFVDEDGNEVEL